MTSLTAIVKGEVVQHAKKRHMLVSNEPHVQPVEHGEMPSQHKSQLWLRKGGGRSSGRHPRRSTGPWARRCMRTLIMPARSVVMQGTRGMLVCDKAVKSGAMGRIARIQNDYIQVSRNYMRGGGRADG